MQRKAPVTGLKNHSTSLFTLGTAETSLDTAVDALHRDLRNAIVDHIDNAADGTAACQHHGAARGPAGIGEMADLDAEDVRFSYVEGRDVLHGIDLDVRAVLDEPGEWVRNTADRKLTLRTRDGARPTGMSLCLRAGVQAGPGRARRP